MTLDTNEDGKIILTPKLRRYSIDKLLAECDTKALPPADMALWNAAQSVGGEVWS